MDKERIRLLEAVAETARSYAKHMSSHSLMAIAISALDAHSPAPPADTVPLRIAVYRNKKSKLWETGCLDEGETVEYQDKDWPLHAIITANVPASSPAVPVVEGECG